MTGSYRAARVPKRFWISRWARRWLWTSLQPFWISPAVALNEPAWFWISPAGVRVVPIQMPKRLQDVSPFTGHSPGQERPLGGYGLLIGSYGLATTAFGTWLKRSGRTLPEQIGTRDLMLITVATHKLTRIVARDRVTSVIRAPVTRFQDDAGPSEVSEAARGRGLRRAIGELAVCPYCQALWVATGFVAAHVTAPRATRAVTSVLAIVTGADALQIAYAKAEDLL